MIDATRLRQFCPVVEPHLDAINQAIERFKFDTLNRFTYWIANAAFETGGFRVVSENLSYTKAETLVRIFRKYFDRDHNGAISDAELAFATSMLRQPVKLGNFVYANRMGNGDAASGDGFLHRGQGWFQLTGSDNHKAYSLAIYGDLRVWQRPEMLTLPPDAALSAGWFAEQNRLNRIADRGDFKGYCGLINTGSIAGIAHGLDDGDRRDLDSREDWRVRAVNVFADLPWRAQP